MRKKVGMITLGISLILCGTAIILAHYTSWQFEDIFIVWPAFLILLGLEFIFTKLWYDIRKREVSLSPSVTSIILAAVIIFASTFWVNNGTSQLNQSWNFNLSGVIQDTYNDTAEGSFTLERNQLTNVEKIVIDNVMGSVEVVPSDNDQLKLDAQISIATNDREAAEKLIDQIITVTEGRETKIKSSDSVLNRSHSIQHVNIMLWLPKNIEVQISTGFGNVTVKGIENNVTVKQQHSDVELSNIKGNVEVDCSFGRIYIRKIQGDAIINNAHGKVDIEEVSGKAQVENSFNSTYAKQIGKDLAVASSHGQVKAEYIGGNVKIKNEFAEVSCSNIEGSVEVFAEHSGVILSHIKGNISAETSFDSLRLTNSSFENADIKASTTYGTIKCDDEVGLNVRHEDNLEEASTKNGSGSQKIRLINQHGEIRIINN